MERLRSYSYLVVIISLYLLTASLYALNTPPWQTPDEPAHYNYIAYLATQGKLPVLQPGNWDQEYLEFLKANKFPPGYSISTLRYESHQPPLYYTLATPVFLAIQVPPYDGPISQTYIELSEVSRVVPLRFISVFLGAMLLFVTYRVIGLLFPEQPFIPLTAVAFIAVLPQHVATTAAVNNDTLAELVLAAVVFVSLVAIKGGLGPRRSLILGVLLGLAFLSKTTIYVPALLAVGAAFWWGGKHWSRLATILGLALLLSGWWFVRNALTYSGFDIFGWARHDSIVIGQPTTAQWLAQFGLGGVISAFLTTTFRSFWGQFGWMGVVMDERIYLALFIFSLFLFIGFLLALRQRSGWKTLQNRGVLLFMIWLLIVFAALVWYNLRFVQHQGRYLFPALIPLGLFFAICLGYWATLLARFFPNVATASPGNLTSSEIIVFAAFYLGFITLDIMALYWFIIPQLSLSPA